MYDDVSFIFLCEVVFFVANSQEIEALCEGWHPLFKEEDIVVLDGSDSWKRFPTLPTPTLDGMMACDGSRFCFVTTCKGVHEHPHEAV